jgi:hypothetical protein
VRYCLKRVQLVQNSMKRLSTEDDRSAFRENHNAIEHPEPLEIAGEPTGSFQDSGQERNTRITLDSTQQQQTASSLEQPGPAAAAATTIPALDAECGGRLIADQVRSEFPCGYRSQFIKELKTAPDTLRQAEFRAQAPSPGEIFAKKGPAEVIRSCRPQQPDINAMFDWANFCFIWFSRWMQQLLPDRQTRQAAILAAEAILLSEDFCFTYRV